MAEEATSVVLKRQLLMLVSKIIMEYRLTLKEEENEEVS